jgi:hypothetical protein
MQQLQQPTLSHAHREAEIDPYARCPYPAGSEDKIRWLQARAALCLPLFIEADALHRVRVRKQGRPRLLATYAANLLRPRRC